MKISAPLVFASPHHANAPQLSDPACEWERRELLELGENIISETPSAWPKFQSWITAVHRLSDSACKAFTPEAALTSLTGELRRLWMQTALEKMERDARAPAPRSVRPIHAAAGIYLAANRDGDSRPNALENRCPAMPAASEWAADHVVFSSAQGALASVLYWAMTQGFWDPNNAPHLTFAGNNFETQTLLDTFHRAGLTWGQAKNIAGSSKRGAKHKEADKKSRVILIEPAYCDDAANVMNMAAFHKTWRKTLAAEPTLIILDTTLTGPLFPIGELLESLEGKHVVINLRSGEELDQAGLELGTVGIASIYRHKSTTAETHCFGAALRKARTAFDAGLSAFDMAALQAPWFLNDSYFRRYTLAVFDNNARVADDLAGGGHLFANVLHPKFARTLCRWAQAPYTLLKLQEPSAENYEYLERVLAYEARRRGIFLAQGKGFGYRSHRFQAVIPQRERGTPFLRVAMGARSTPSLERAVRLLRDVSNYRDFSQLVAQYKDVVPRTVPTRH